MYYEVKTLLNQNKINYLKILIMSHTVVMRLTFCCIIPTPIHLLLFNNFFVLILWYQILTQKIKSINVSWQCENFVDRENKSSAVPDRYQ